MTKWHGGKGSGKRKNDDQKQYADNWEKIFNKKKDMQMKPGETQKFVYIDTTEKLCKQCECIGFQENTWSEFVADTKGRRPSMIDKKQINNIKKFTNYYLKENKFSLPSLNYLKTTIKNKPKFTKQGLTIHIKNLHEAIWISWYLSIIKGRAKVCSVCALPFYAKYKNADTCSGTCRNLKSKRRKICQLN
jgi:hypothetical protein